MKNENKLKVLFLSKKKKKIVNLLRASHYFAKKKRREKESESDNSVIFYFIYPIKFNVLMRKLSKQNNSMKRDDETKSIGFMERRNKQLECFLLDTSFSMNKYIQSFSGCLSDIKQNEKRKKNEVYNFNKYFAVHYFICEDRGTKKRRKGCNNSRKY